MTKNLEIDITRHCEDWPLMEDALIQAVSEAVVGAHHHAPAEISIVLADNSFIQALNKTYRGTDKPTNVLSFPQDDPQHLGDIVMALEIIQSEAVRQQKTLENHILHLVVHGALHLLGYDHETEDDAEKMENLEIKILKKMGIKNPYESLDSMAYSAGE